MPDTGNASGDRGTRRVVLLTATMMMGKIITAGTWGRTSRRRPSVRVRDVEGRRPRGFSSAIILGVVAPDRAYDLVVRVMNPLPITYGP